MNPTTRAEINDIKREIARWKSKLQKAEDVYDESVIDLSICQRMLDHWRTDLQRFHNEDENEIDGNSNN